MRWDAFAVFIFFFIVVTVLGFVAARWRRGDLDLLNEWGLAGRRFGTVVTWFLLGGDLYTAYTFIAVPAAMYGLGAVNGFFAVPYTILIYPLAFVVLPRFWAVCKQHGYVTPADFVKGRFGSGTLALIIAFTGILATLPYIALQMFGIQVSLAALGIPTVVPILGIPVDLPLITCTGHDRPGQRPDDLHRTLCSYHLYSNQVGWFCTDLCCSPTESSRQPHNLLFPGTT
jgi:SSS family solute:Na+ symporter